MTTKNKGCRLQVIEPVHCGSSSILLLTFSEHPVFVFVLREEEEVQSVQLSLFVYFCYCGSGATILGRRSSGHNGGQSATAQILQ